MTILETFQKLFWKYQRRLPHDIDGKLSDSRNEIFQLHFIEETKPEGSERFMTVSQNESSTQISNGTWRVPVRILKYDNTILQRAQFLFYDRK